MASVPRATVDAFTKGINGISNQARQMLAARLAQIDIADVSASAPEVVAVMEEYCGAAVRNVEALANRFYRMARMQALGVDNYDPDASSDRVPAATEEATRAILQRAVDGDVDGCVEQLLQRIDYEIKRGAGTTVLNAGQRDPVKPRYARVPTGAETCEFCIMLASRGFVYHSETSAGMLDHWHANCVVAETEVAGTGLLAGMRREYKGTLVNIRTRGGRNLTVTPNHPILTARGWVVAGEIKEFDNLICANFVHGDNGSVPDVNDVPPTAKEVFESCNLMDSALFDGVPVAAENLNGEIIGDSNIKVVNPLGFLKRAIEATAGEPIEHCGFSVAQSEGSISCPLLDAFGSLNLFGFRNNPTSNGLMGGCSLCGSFFGGHGSSANDSGFGLAARGDSSFGEPSDDRRTADVEAGGDGVNALAIIERFENSIRHWDALTARLDAIASEYTKDGCVATSDFLDNLFGGGTRLIEIDDVESVSFSERSCHVYNLSTKGGWYVSSGIVTHNCDCRVVPGFGKEPKVDGYDPDYWYAMYEDLGTQERQRLIRERKKLAAQQ